jgi:hypothetical protein
MRFDRQRVFRRNEKLEELLHELTALLEPVEERVLERFHMPRYPAVFVVGAPRCGSTLMMQWLADTGRFAYPTNLLSRFYGAPYVGAKIQQLLTAPEYNFNDEILDFSGEISFSSDLGKTRGALAPNEFWYFWRRFFPITEPGYVDEGDLERADGPKFVAELAAIESVFDKPLAMKGLLLQLNISFLSSLFDKVLFLFVRRHPFYNIQSLLEARLRYYGDRHAWYSIKPREYDLLQDLEPIEQVAGQVFFTTCAIERDLGRIGAARGLVVDYEEFCQRPARVFEQIKARFSQQGFRVDWAYTGPEQFHSTNQIRLPVEDCQRIVKAYRAFSGRELKL